ncbi:hypothetical protein DSO57_1031307 [Entomophthora muscae]|uniref:Uncharacterized protein n=1 Tax=Entomophthora muscae TaxID=34485 RepID=A0ACC2TNF0_9FUNG|nr:hypothetical protein DSO57_1031307 [Entomophthora muscae]
MILPALKFVVFSLAPFVMLLWTSFLVLWSYISSLVHLVSDDPSSLLHLPSGFLISGEALVRSLTCNNLDLYSQDSAFLAPFTEEISVALPPPWRMRSSYPCRQLKAQPLSPLAVNSLPPLALDCAIFPYCTKKGPKTPAKLLHSLKDLAHTVDERFVLAYPADPLPLVAPSWEETLVNLDYLLAWCYPLLKTIRASQSEVATLTLNNSSEFQMSSTSSSQSDLTTEIRMKPSSLFGSIQQSFSFSQLNLEPDVM